MNRERQKTVIKNYLASNKPAQYYFFSDLFEQKLKQLKKDTPQNIKYLFPVKAFPHEAPLQIAGKLLDGFDVSNQAELNLVKPFLGAQHRIWCSSPVPVKLDSDFPITKDGKDAQRINFNLMLNQNSRFGSDHSKGLTKENLHLHLGFQDNNADVFIKIAEKISQSSESVPIKKINFGGGFEFNNMAELSECLSIVSELLPDFEIFFEPGNWLTKNTLCIAGRVLERFNQGGDLILTTSISQLAHLRWSQEINLLPIGDKNSKFEKITICGPTCAETDIISVLSDSHFINAIGDLLIIDKISSYSYAWSTSFNGIEKPDLIVL